MRVAARLAGELGLPADTPLVVWATAWDYGTNWPGADQLGRLVDEPLTAALAGYAVDHGRSTPWDTVEATTCTVQLVRDLVDELPTIGAGVRLGIHASIATAWGLTDDTGAARFTGEVTRVLLSAGLVTVQLTGLRARLGRVYVGDEPWPAELDGARALRILELARDQVGFYLDPGDVDPGTATVRGRDVDRQPALRLLDDLAESTGGQVVERGNGHLYYYDAEHQRNVAPVVELDGSELLAGLTWETGLDELVNDVTVEYGDAPASGDRPTVRVVDLHSVDTLGLGYLSAAVSTELLNAGDAGSRARLLVARRGREAWLTPTLTVDLVRTVSRGELVQLLDVDHGTVVRVTGLPSLSPFTSARQVVQGYSESLTPYAWRLALAVAPVGLSGAPARWVDVPPEATWADLGNEAPAGMTWLEAGRWSPYTDASGRWVDQPADLDWYAVPDVFTWANYPS